MNTIECLRNIRDIATRSRITGSDINTIVIPDTVQRITFGSLHTQVRTNKGYMTILEVFDHDIDTTKKRYGLLRTCGLDRYLPSTICVDEETFSEQLDKFVNLKDDSGTSTTFELYHECSLGQNEFQNFGGITYFNSAIFRREYDGILSITDVLLKEWNTMLTAHNLFIAHGNITSEPQINLSTNEQKQNWIELFKTISYGTAPIFITGDFYVQRGKENQLQHWI